jgi:DNA repair exonuclease SbcCD nuclease subunit
MRIVHTADIHLDSCFAAPGMPAGFGNRRRQSLRDVFQGTVRRAGEWQADALIIAGDLFELDRITRDTVAFLVSQFGSIPKVPVFIAPGNHDPYMARSPYASANWPDNVTIFTEPRWSRVDVPDSALTIHGFAFNGPDISTNPWGTLTIEPDDRTHIAIGHGSEMGHIPPGKDAYAPFDVSDAVCDGLAYLALGHFHTCKELTGPFNTDVYYCGVPEGHGFGETGPRYHLEVEINGDKVTVNPVQSCRAVYETHDIDVTSIETTQQILDDLRGRPHEANVARIARIRLAGTARPGLMADLPVVQDTLAAEFDAIEWVDETLPAEDYDTLAHDATSLGGFVARLNEEIKHEADDARRRVLERSRDVGLAAYRGSALPILGGEEA